MICLCIVIVAAGLSMTSKCRVRKKVSVMDTALGFQKLSCSSILLVTYLRISTHKGKVTKMRIWQLCK